MHLSTGSLDHWSTFSHYFHAQNLKIPYHFSAIAKDPYEILGVSRDASEGDIKKAYRKLSKELHPDKHKGDKAAEDRYKDVNMAYEILSDPKKKQAYDQFGNADAAGGPGGFDFSGFQQAGGDFSGFADIFEQFFGGAGGRSRKPSNSGEDLEVRVGITLTDVLNGIQQGIELDKLVTCADCSGSGAAPGSKTVTCEDCGGTGQITKQQQSFFGVISQSFVCSKCRGSGQVPEQPCTKCSGEGRLQQRVTVTIDIPPGLHDGQTIRVREQGNAGRQGGPAGDLYVHVQVQPDEQFVREGDDVRSEASVSAVDAILGTQIMVHTVPGQVELKIPEGSQPGQIFRLKGKGLPQAGSSRFGDHYVHLKVEIPKKLSKKEREVLETWRGMQS